MRLASAGSNPPLKREESCRQPVPVKKGASPCFPSLGRAGIRSLIDEFMGQGDVRTEAMTLPFEGEQRGPASDGIINWVVGQGHMQQVPVRRG